MRSGLTGASLVVLAGYVFDPDGVEYVASSSPRVLLTRTLEAAELAGVARIRPPDSADLPRRSRLRRVSLALAALGGDFVASDGVQHT